MRANGPVATVYIVRDGTAPVVAAEDRALGTLQGIVIGLTLGVAMLMLNRYTTKYWNHVAICTTVGLAYSAYPRIADIVFSDFPPGLPVDDDLLGLRQLHADDHGDGVVHETPSGLT